ncbi:hypothetical protein ACIBQ1_35465 [Nonomuraea sp. NPDC050153]|uniref:hypothetical protein n=1 Tax=Nonomuraea sp. NPDC050153 TaxID=3364359 RepID=UPI0037B5DD8E
MNHGLPSRGNDSREVFDLLRNGLSRLFLDSSQEVVLMPPVIPLEVVRRAEYDQLFPHLLGIVRTGAGSSGPELALTPAACHHVYPEWQGASVDGPKVRAVEADCFRFETSTELGRLRSFRMLEFVCLGSPETCDAWQKGVRSAARDFFASLGVDVRIALASDPFFGRGGRLLANNQVEEGLKQEFVAPVSSELYQAIASVNMHREHMAKVFDISGPNGEAWHTSCLAFGLDRVYLALEHAHGPDIRKWPLRE